MGRVIGLGDGASAAFIGATASAAYAVIARFVRAVEEIDAHDLGILNRVADLNTWVRDDNARLGDELILITADAQAAGLYVSGPHNARLAGARKQAWQRYRDQRTATDRLRNEYAVRERLRHRFWRSYRNQPMPSVELEPHAQVVASAWSDESGGCPRSRGCPRSPQGHFSRRN